MAEDIQHNEKWKEAIDERKENDQKAVILALRKNSNISMACAKAGISTTTFYRWYNNNPLFRREVEEAQNEGDNVLNDLAESKLLQHINAGDMKAAMYRLDRCHPKYQTKSMHERSLAVRDEKENEYLANKPFVKEIFDLVKDSGMLDYLMSTAKTTSYKMYWFLYRFWPFIKEKGKIVQDEDFEKYE